jgi:hypothetical protein
MGEKTQSKKLSRKVQESLEKKSTKIFFLQKPTRGGPSRGIIQIPGKAGR